MEPVRSEPDAGRIIVDLSLERCHSTDGQVRSFIHHPPRPFHSARVPPADRPVRGSGETPGTIRVDRGNRHPGGNTRFIICMALSDQCLLPKKWLSGSQEHFHHNLIVMLALDLYLPR
jgi:hypothetical protein